MVWVGYDRGMRTALLTTTWQRCTLAALLCMTPRLAGPTLAQDAPAGEAPPAQAPAAETPAGPTVYADPQAVFADAQTAFNARDWSAFLMTVSPPRRNQLIVGLAIPFATMAQDEMTDPRVKELVETYLPPGFDPLQTMVGSDDPEGESEKLARKIKNRKEFFNKAMDLAFSLEYDRPEMAPELTELRDLEIDEEAKTASGTIVLVSEEVPESTDQWLFEKVGDSWYITMQ